MQLESIVLSVAVYETYWCASVFTVTVTVSMPHAADHATSMAIGPCLGPAQYDRPLKEDLQHIEKRQRWACHSDTAGRATQHRL